MYKLQKNVITNELTTIVRILDNAFIPIDTNNTDYQEYLAWLSEGNTPEEAE